MAPRMPTFNRNSRNGSMLHRRLRRRESKAKTKGPDPLEISVPSLYDISQNTNDQHNLYSRRIRISPGGQCTPVNEEGTSDEEPVAKEKVLHSMTKTSSGRLKFGMPNVSIWDMLHEILLWLSRQSKGKNIKASKEVLKTYHDLFLHGEVPFSIKVRTALRSWPLRPMLVWIEFLAAIISVVVYILTTYRTGDRPHWQRLAEIVCGLFFVIDYILNVYSSPVRLYYIFSLRGVIDFVSTLPIILYWSPIDNGAAGILLFFRALRIMPLITHVGGRTGGAIKEHIFILVMYTFGVVFIAAGVLQWVDNKMTKQSVKDENACSDTGCMTFFDAFWLMIVTMSTVGYGDITPKSNWGRAILIVLIISALVILPPQINRILHLASKRPYGGAFDVRKVVGSRFFIVSGNISFETVQAFLAEFYHPTHEKDMWAFPLQIVIMAPFKPSFELKSLLMHYKDRVEFIQGTPIKDSDLDRVSAKVASAVYLLADAQAKDPAAEDAAQIVRTLAVHRHCGSKVRVIVELLQPEKAADAIWDDTKDGIEIICLDPTRFKLLARSCHIRGLSTFVINLFRSGLDISKPLKDHWMMKYMHGLHQEVFPVILPDLFHEEKLTFEQAAELVYRKFSVILFGIDVRHEEDGEEFRDVVLYPRGRVLRPSDVGLVLSPDLKTAEKISKLDTIVHRRPGLLQFFCAPHVKSGLTKDSYPEEFRKLLDVVKQGKFSDMELNDKSQLNHELKIAIFDQNAKESEDSSVPKEDSSRKGDTGVSRHYGLTSHSCLVKGDKDGSSHGKARKQGIISQVSAGKAEMKVISAHQTRDTNKSLSKAKIFEEISDSLKIHRRVSFPPDSKSSAKTPRGAICNLEDAINVMMSWPPQEQNYKPDPAILERHATEILENLQRRTMKLVNLPVPHILVCIQGKWPSSLFYFVSQLRTPGLPNSPVVILHPNFPSESDWGNVGFFDDVYFVKGSPSLGLDLLRAGVIQAEKVVILTQGVQLEQSIGEHADDQDRSAPSQTFTLDVNNVFIAATVERLLRHETAKDRVIVELQQETEIQYLQPRLLFDRRIFDSEMYLRNRSATFQFAPPYIGGKAFCPAALGVLLYATFFNRQTVAIVDQLISGGQVLEYDEETNEERASDTIIRDLGQIPVPKSFVGFTFSELFIGMLRDHGALALGLYRITGLKHDGLGFVYTNPLPTEVVEATDLVYILH
ncbi:uncharacterized protein [Physcomitrium patens]|uniref:Uncharacterized protein n=4 Tax=Physcomitrium patens TaxID=3218 RepID=A0A2K1K6L2_PHYPA|nr:calcium-activated potassium channel slo-1-like isoform X4 [Physcomitrium patens]XP_024382524.1 calcium-activated potassium channel slo-1-like isoform X4 [Physcomitrium patens]XP_024382525.1 calcium-activated potassium channel slo-1-like isoform X4 [Physcomitrium patens]PNR49412.1 hypothetical protein PHYPA_011308 [Physcomitrium patens]|eukprot:XP_024382523.1 calcium-activated potassium channel slo-1-like isoform X4 [Physcomitrella patens]